MMLAVQQRRLQLLFVPLAGIGTVLLAWLVITVGMAAVFTLRGSYDRRDS